MSQRKFFQYELNWLKKFGFDLDKLNSLGEKPVEYVTDHAEFLGSEFVVSPDTLIPRIETEEIIPIATQYILNLPSKHLNLADIGTGSGCIGISIAINLYKKNFSNFDLYLSDTSSKALKVTQKNINNLLHSKTENIHLIKSNLFEKYPPNIKFDLITANLPYIPSSRISTLDSSVKDYEPISALDGGENGTIIINKFLNSVAPFLESRFLVILEIDSSHTLDIFKIPDIAQGIIKMDSLGNRRFLILTPNK